MRGKFILYFGITLVALFFNFSYVNASRHSSAEEMNYALNQSVNSLRKTDDYASVLTRADYNFFIGKKKICYEEFDFIRTIRSSGNIGGQEAATCLASAYLILMLRKQFFDSIESYVQAFQSGDESGKRYYEGQYREFYSQAEKWRTQFRQNYGY